MSGAHLPWRHVLLALAVVAVWGTNFVVIKWALGTLPPLLLGTLRFALAFAPAALFVARPAASWRTLAAYGALIGAGQFGLLFIALRGHITPGLASLVVQVQVFFTIGLAMALAGERVRVFQALALVVASAGLVVIALHTDADTTPLGIALVLLAALAWAGGNLIAKRAGRVDMLGFMVWSSLFAVPPLALLSLLIEGPSAIARGLAAAGPAIWAAVVWQSIGNTLFGFGAWAWLLARHPAATITPMALLVPVFGMGASAWLLAEPLPSWKLVAAAFVLTGLALNVVWPRYAARLRQTIK
ncbi:MAG TPA: EamA family transporter [Steroidobacteraceae bacterium]|nr:EamA family transporter [Steroidobacteraceae bacterium]